MIGTVGGFFSGLFGVGGGTVIVPLLIVWLGYGEREATGTSLMAIVVIAAYGAIGQALYGNVDRLGGARRHPGDRRGRHRDGLQQRIPERAMSLLFAGAAGGHRRRADLF